MKNDRSRYSGHRFPPEIISYAVWLYHRFCLSFRDVEDLLAERGVIVSYEAIRRWCQKFGPGYARKRTRTTSYHYRQTKKLLGRPANYPVRRASRHGTLRQQSRRSIASTDPAEGAADAPIQICSSSPTVSLPPCCRPESFSSWTPFAEIYESAALAIAILRGLADSDSGLRRLHDKRPIRIQRLFPA